MRVILALGQSGVSNFALVRQKIKKNALCLNQSAISNFALYVVKHVKGVLATLCESAFNIVKQICVDPLGLK